MLIKKTTLSKIDICKIRKSSALFLAGIMLLVLAVSLDVHAAERVKANGILQSIERDGTVIIDGMGYFVSPSLEVQDHAGRPIVLHDINLPQNVYFEYKFTTQGFMVIFIKENAV